MGLPVIPAHENLHVVVLHGVCVCNPLGRLAQVFASKQCFGSTNLKKKRMEIFASAWWQLLDLKPFSQIVNFLSNA